MKKWYEIYSTEEELINDMLDTYTDDSKESWRCITDYGFIRNAKLYYCTHDSLTPDQLAKVKMLASEIYDNVHRVKKMKDRNDYKPILILKAPTPKIKKESED